MSNKQKNESEVLMSNPTTFIRLSSYYRNYLKIKFGGEPVRFPLTHHLNHYVQEYIQENKEMNSVYEYAYSRAEWDDILANQSIGHFHYVPSPEEQKEFLEIELPRFVVRGYGQKQVSNYWQFSKTGSVAFRLRVKEDFWSEACLFVNDYFVSKNILGMTGSGENAIEEFMIKYNIPMSDSDNMIRYYKRFRKRMKDEIDIRSATKKQL